MRVSQYRCNHDAHSDKNNQSTRAIFAEFVRDFNRYKVGDGDPTQLPA